MAQWSNTDEANSAPNFVVDATTGQTGIQQYGNTVFGVASDEAEPGAGSPGWVRIVKGTGSIKDVMLVSGGEAYSNDDVIAIGSDTGTLTTDANGTIVSIDVDFSGDQIDELPVVAIATEDGEGAEFIIITED